MPTACITTWLQPTYPPGEVVAVYRIASVVEGKPDTMTLSTSKFVYSTTKEARRAARRRGFEVLPGVATDWRAAMRKLGCTRRDDDETDAVDTSATRTST